MPEVIEQAVPGTVVSSGALVTPGGAQGPGGSTGPPGPPGPSGSGTGDMLKSVYDTNGDNIVDHAALADNATNATNAAAVPWTGVTGKPSTFAPSAHGTTHLDNGTDIVPVVTTTRTGLAPKLSGSATTYLDGTGAYSTPPGTAGNMLKSVYDTNADNIVDQAAAVPWTGVTGKPATFPPDATAELVARKGVVSGYPSLDGSALVPIAQLPAPTSGDAAAAQLVKGNDSRLTNARTPTAHASTHVTGGSDIIVPASSSTAGLLKQLSGNATDFVDGTNACQNLVTAVQPTIWSVRLRNFNAAGNPNFEIAQRNTGTTITGTTANTFVEDRWGSNKSGTATLGYTIGRALTLTVPGGGVLVPGTNFAVSNSFMRLTLTTAQATMAAGDYLRLLQTIEGSVFRELMSDVFSISLLVRSSVANLNFGISIVSSDSAKSLTKLCTVPTANVWTLITLNNCAIWSAGGVFSVVPGAVGCLLEICLAAGATYTAPAADTWQNAHYMAPPGISNWAASAVNSTFDIGMVQIEPGPVCSTLMDKPFTQNYDECLRYFCKSYQYATAVGTAASAGASAWISTLNTQYAMGNSTFPKLMAKIPTVTIYNHVTGAANNAQGQDTNNRAVSNAQSPGLNGFNGINFGSAVSTTAVLFHQGHYTADTGW